MGELAGRAPHSGTLRSGMQGKACNLLGVAPDASREQIIEAHRRLIAMVHPDRGGTNEAVHEANAARDLLLARLAETARARRRGHILILDANPDVWNKTGLPELYSSSPRRRGSSCDGCACTRGTESGFPPSRE
jgi:curved DNA-binding protein CbpA